MKLSTLLATAGLVSLAQGLAKPDEVRKQWFPLNKKEEIPNDFVPYSLGQDVMIDCIQRNIDNGEHKFDDKERIIYAPFPKCKETGKPLSLKYGISEDLNCTIGFTDELYHLFELYIHEDAPFSCRIPFSSEQNSIESGGAYIPLTFNFRGEIHDSHLDIDSNINLLVIKPQNSKEEENSIVSAVAFSSGTNATRVVISDNLTLNLAVRWINTLQPSNSNQGTSIPFTDGFYKFPMSFIPISYNILYLLLAVVVVGTGLIVLGGSYKSLTKRVQNKHYKSLESDFDKKD